MKVASGCLSVVLWIGIFFAGIASLMGLFWLSCLFRYSQFIIDFIMKVNIYSFLVLGIFSLVFGQFLFAIACGFISALNYWYYWSVKNRIAFASAILSAAAQGIKDHFNALMVSSFLTVILQVAWVGLWAVSALGIANATGILDDFFREASSANKTAHANDIKDQDPTEITNAQFAAMVGALLSLYWGIEVLRYTLHTIVSGTIGVWFFQPDRPYAVRGSAFRALTTSFGPICLGSLIVSLVHTLREVLKMIRNRRSERRGESSSRRGGRGENPGIAILFCLVDCLAQMLESVLQYINKYAFCYVAAYGHGFIEAGTKVINLFQGW